MGKSTAVENIVPKDHGAGIVSNKLFANNKSLGQSIRRRLHRIGTEVPLSSNQRRHLNYNWKNESEKTTILN